MTPTTVDHDTLIRIETKLDAVLKTLEGADVPARCASHEQRHKAHEARLRTIEGRIWAVATGIVLALAGAIIQFVITH